MGQAPSKPVEQALVGPGAAGCGLDTGRGRWPSASVEPSGLVGHVHLGRDVVLLTQAHRLVVLPT